MKSFPVSFAAAHVGPTGHGAAARISAKERDTERPIVPPHCEHLRALLGELTAIEIAHILAMTDWEG